MASRAGIECLGLGVVQGREEGGALLEGLLMPTNKAEHLLTCVQWAQFGEFKLMQVALSLMASTLI